ncbi:oxidoreductase [Kaistia algarum]|uniref:Gfo/Idh/MocA family protein n=1 Tax=Kaistia algarum TaxID=2083279 RepID=UPI000CE895A4|nr:Gfo/Idh/MocA family oxidoreductase [Kaistia algarum]MCX5512759.1 Gfo/Idh/MocA family oxidoreductase [Kaistia algarum]PPE81741.1 oxidoreductase [Kaistia algarum]
MTHRRAAVIGCGFFSQNHLNAWNDLRERVSIVAVCDIDRAKAEAAAKRFGVPKAYTNVDEMLASESLDFVDIATTAPSHLALAGACAARGVPVIVQKPLAPDWTDARALVAALDRAGLPMMVHENFRFQAPLLRAAELVNSGAIGKVVWGRFSFRTGYDIYAGQPYLAEVERFSLLDVGIHVLDVARVFMGEAETVACRAQSVRPGIKGEDRATVLLGHAGGATSVCEISYASRPDPDPFPQMVMELDGDAGSLRIDPGYQIVWTDAAGTHRETVTPEPVSWGAEPWTVTQDSVRAIQRHWLDCLDSGAVPATSGHDNLKTFALVEAAYASAASGQTIRTTFVD